MPIERSPSRESLRYVLTDWRPRWWPRWLSWSPRVPPRWRRRWAVLQLVLVNAALLFVLVKTDDPVVAAISLLGVNLTWWRVRLDLEPPGNRAQTRAAKSL